MQNIQIKTQKSELFPNIDEEQKKTDIEMGLGQDITKRSPGQGDAKGGDQSYDGQSQSGDPEEEDDEEFSANQTTPETARTTSATMTLIK